MSEQPPTPARKVSAERLEASFRAIAAIGALPGGGCERLAFSSREREAHAEFRKIAAGTGLNVRTDEIGNSFARLEPAGVAAGSAPTGDVSTAPTAGAAPILTGSHLDTVAGGGCYDGAAGVLCSLEALLALADAQARGEVTLSRPVEVVAWANEEGARFAPAMMGSAVYAGVLSLEEALQSRDSEGITVAEALAASPAKAPPESSPAGDPGVVTLESGETAFPGRVPGAYLELHIEQGVELEEAGIPVAVVAGVQAQVAGDWEIRGRSAHAGATPMHRRSDALVAAAELITAAPEIAQKHAPGVATVGSLTVLPGSRNSVPGSARGTVDLRHPDEEAVEIMAAEFVEAGRRAAARQECGFSFAELWRAPRVAFDPELLSLLEGAAHQAGVESLPLFSAAGHDAVHLAPLAPSAMLFVPSIGGVSHHPEETTAMADLVAGAQVLAQALGTLAATPTK